MPIPPGQSDDPVAQFPTTVFDGISESRPTGKEFTAPEANDWQQIVNEMIAVQKAVRPAYDDLIIWVSPTGVAANATGSITNPYATIAAALAAISATKKIVCLLPGTYTLTAITVIPVTQDGLKIIGVGDVTIVGADANQAFSLTPGAQGAAFTVTLENLKFTQYAAKKGLYIDDTAIDGAVTVNINNCTFTMDTSGSSIDLLHAVDQTVTINCTDCTFTGPITVDCINASDAFNFTRCTLTGGLVSDTGAVAAAFVFKFCEIKASGVTGGHANQTIVALYCTADDDTLAETGEFAGSHTESLVSPVSA
jgi:hypothetical protein